MSDRRIFRVRIVNVRLKAESSPSKRLRAARKAAGFKTARDAARHFGWVDSTYRGHEAGPREISKRAALKYARAFGVELSWLLSGYEANPAGQDDDLRAEVKAALKRMAADTRDDEQKLQDAVAFVLDTRLGGA